jgi:hypothetical protein
MEMESSAIDSVQCIVFRRKTVYFGGTAKIRLYKVANTFNAAMETYRLHLER